MKIFNYFVCVLGALFVQCFAAQSQNSLIHFILGVDDQPVVVSKAITRDGTLHYRAYSLSVIDQAGYYRLAGNVSNTITISASNVQLNLGGNTVTGSIILNSNLKNITINNGVIVGNATDAITIGSECSSIKIFDISIQDQGISAGIVMNTVFDSTIRNCEMIQNTTGITLNACANITIENCSAIKNTCAGFSLISSLTCILSDCEAISTGAINNFVTNTNAIGFVTNNGVGNIFQNCIANSTQALVTTDYNSLIAGFAFRGAEQKSCITRCTASNTATSSNGLTIPYGIYLESTLAASLTLTAIPVIPIPAAGIIPSGWSPDGQYFAVGTSETTPKIRVYYFDRIKNVFSQVASPNITPRTDVRSLQWSPNGQFIAAGSVAGGTDTRLRIYLFDPINNSLQVFALPDVVPSTTVQSLSWRPDMKYLAVGLNTASSIRLRIYKFDPIAKTLTSVATGTIGNTANSISWSSDGSYLAVGVQFAGGESEPLRIFSFNESNNSLVNIAVPNINPGSNILSVSWAPDGLYVAAGTNTIAIYSFNRVNNALTRVAIANISPGTNVNTVAWSSDGKYVVSGSANAPRVNVYFFDRAANTLTRVAQPANQPTTNVASAIWSPDGQFITAVTSAGDPLMIYVYGGLSFPTGNIITHNTVYCNSGSSAATQSGVGISGPSIGNWIVQNTVYSNPMNPPFASTNYQFVCNVFNPLFQDAPTLVQNIALSTCAPIPTRPDAVQNFEILLSKLTDIATKIDLVTLS